MLAATSSNSADARAIAKVAVFIAIVVAAIVADRFFGFSTMIANGEIHDVLQVLVEQNFALACISYVAFAIIGCVVLAVPGVVFALAAGAVFGPVLGTLLCWISMTLGAWGSFFVGRYFLKDALKPKLASNELLDRFLFSGADRSDVSVLAVTRLVPLFPFNLQNFAYGITDIRFAPYAIYSALFILPGTAAYTVTAAGVIDAQHRVAYILVAVVLFALSLGAAAILKRKAGLS